MPALTVIHLRPLTITFVRPLTVTPVLCLVIRAPLIVIPAKAGIQNSACR